MPKLIVAGSGIKSVAHISQETKAVIGLADKVLYLINEDYVKQWVEREAKNAESLEKIYFAHPQRAHAYHAISRNIVDEYRRFNSLCVLLYGHPTVFAESALNAVHKIRQEGGDAVILPAISTLDCLFSDLAIDPGDKGLFCIDATELLVYRRAIDSRSHVVLWQLANLAMSNQRISDKLALLQHYLLQFYDAETLICMYEAAKLPTQVPKMDWISLEALPRFKLSPIATLYIPPQHQEPPCMKTIKQLEIDIEAFKPS